MPVLAVKETNRSFVTDKRPLSTVRRILKADIALHMGLFIFSVTAGIPSGVFTYRHSAHWIYPCISALTTLTAVYSMLYIYFYAFRSYLLGVKAFVFLALFWCLALILPWFWVPYAVYETAKLLFRWTPLALVSIVCSSLFIVILNLVPAASYYRLRSDAASYMNESGHSHQTVEPSNQSSWRDLLENVTIEYAFNELGWWQQSDRYSHQFVIAVFENLRLPSQRIYVRIERDKDAWTPWHGGNLETIFTSSFIEAALTAQSFCVAKYTVNSTFLRRNEYTPSSISAVIQEINKYSSTYSFLAFNCWWFAACSFFCIAHCIKPEHLTIYCRQEAYHELEESTFEQAMSFCDVYYLKSHWPYWILVGHPVIVLTACFSLLTNWCILAYTIPPLLIGVWLTYYIVRIAGAWRGVRRVARCEGLGAERSINLKLACSVAAIVIALMLYSALFLVLAFSPRLAVTRGEVGR